MSKRRYYTQGPRIPLLWQNIGLGILVLAVIGIVAYLIIR
jgi:hypothetical protein